jgi:GNAT superfamily N-acetyltransferase
LLCSFPKDPLLEAQTSWILEMFRRTEEEPDFHCIKAVDNTTGRIIGAAMVQSKSPVTNPARVGLFPMIQSQKFFKTFFPQAGPIMTERLGEKRPASMFFFSLYLNPRKISYLNVLFQGWNSLVVHPDYQRHGVGTALLRYGLNELGMHNEHLFVNSLYIVQDLYARFRWEVIGEIKADLCDWLGENAGFGVYKNVIMAREPSDVV